jgi:hypothetical protein
MTPHDESNLAKFFLSINDWQEAYKSIRFLYVAKKVGQQRHIVAARIHFDFIVSKPAKDLFESENLQAGQWDFPPEVKAEHFIGQLLSSSGISVPGHGHLLLPESPDRPISVSQPMRFHHEGMKYGNRLAVLHVAGAHRSQLIDQQEMDWELKANAMPYDNLNELLSDYLLSTRGNDRVELEVVAHAIAEAWNGSTIVGESANLGIFVPDGLDRTKLRIGYKVIEKGNVISRNSVSGDLLEWTQKEAFYIGVYKFKLPTGSIVQYFVSYMGHAQQFRWLADPTTFQNPRFAALSLIDSSRQLIQTYLTPDLSVVGSQKGKVADEFEVAVAWVLWALGFSTASFGLTQRTRDFADIVAVSGRVHSWCFEVR